VRCRAGFVAIGTLLAVTVGCSNGHASAGSTTSSLAPNADSTTTTSSTTTSMSTSISSTTAPPVPVTAVPTAPACRPSQLRVAFDYEGAGAGSNFGSVQYLNVSSRPCSLAGAPTVIALNRRGIALAEAHVVSGEGEPQAVTIIVSPHVIAVAFLGGSNHPPDDAPNRVCQEYQTLLVTMPGQPRSVRARVSAGGPNDSYSLSSCSGIYTQPVTVPFVPEVPYVQPPWHAFAV
jgi:hypothetical protein